MKPENARVVDNRTHYCTDLQPAKMPDQYGQWTQKHLACYLRTNTRDVLETWITLPDFDIRLTQKHNATVWMIGHMLGYMYDNSALTMKDFLDFMRRARWKAYSKKKNKYISCGKYLDVIDS
jgi:hypothetical protein